MKKLLIFALLTITGAVSAATLEDDMELLGVSVWHKKNISKSEMISMMRDYEVVTATNAIAYSECGKTFFLNSATEFASTLPLPQAGCYFKFIVAAAPAAASYTVVTNGSGNILIGGINESEVDTSDDGPYDNNGDTITFADGVAVVGDYVEMISDGSSWFVNGQANADGGITVTGS